MSDIKYTSCTGRHMGEKLSDFSNVPNIKGLLIKWFQWYCGLFIERGE